MRRLIASEITKIRTVWSTPVLLGVAAVLVAALSAVIAFAPHNNGSQGVLLPPEGTAGWFDDIFEIMNIAGDFALIMGVISVTNEYRHKTITPTLLAVPRRGRLVAAKIAVAAMAGLTIAVTVGVVDMIFGLSVVGGGYGNSSTMVHEFFRLWPGLAAATVLFTIYGVGLGALLKNQVAAIMVGLGFTAVVEPILDGVVPSVGRWLPGSAAEALEQLTARQGPFSANALVHLVSWWEGGLVLVGYGLLLALVGSFTTMRADVT